MRTPMPAPPRPAADPRPVPSGRLTHHSCEIFTCQVTLASCGPPLVPLRAIEEWLRECDRRFSRFRPDSEISQLNRGAGEWQEITAELYELLAHALRVAVASGGLVNIAVLPWLCAAGYVRSIAASPPVAPRDPRVPARAVPPLTEVLELRRHQARLLPGQAVDIAALAKGAWADEVVSRLGPNSAASLGGDVSCRGGGPAGAGWPVAVPSGEVLMVTNGAVATSGTAKRRWGGTAHHLIDPRTGAPSGSDIDQATVVAGTGATADWVSTALVVGGTAVAGALTSRRDVHAARLSADRFQDRRPNRGGRCAQVWR